MKQITMDFNEYEKEIDLAKRNGYKSGMNDFYKILRMIHLVCDKKEAMTLLIETGMSQKELEQVSEWLGLTNDFRGF
jgi:hypothetical protein